MNNVDYWAKRFTQIENVEHNTALVSTQEIQSLLASACSQVDKEINAFYQKYADASEITFADAQTYLQRNDINAFRADIAAYTRMAMNNSDGQFERILQALSSRVHIQRLEALKIRTAMVVRGTYGKVGDELTKTCEAVMRDAHLRTAYEIQHGIGKYEPFQQLNKKALDLVVNKPWTADGKTFSQRIWQHQEQLTYNLQKQFTQGFMSGIDPKEMTSSIIDTFGVSERNASRLVQTECAYFAAEGDRTAYEDLSIEKYQILGTLDERTCEECESMDGQVMAMKDYSQGDTAPPFHSCCRCTTIPVIEDSVIDTGTRAARDENGKTIQVDDDLSYKAWYNNYVIEPANFDNNLLDLKSSNGIIVSEISAHAVSRAIERGTTAEEVKDAIISPLHVYPIKTDKEGKKSQKLLGENVAVVINPDTGKIITMYRTSSNLRRKYKNESQDE